MPSADEDVHMFRSPMAAGMGPGPCLQQQHRDAAAAASYSYMLHDTLGLGAYSRASANPSAQGAGIAGGHPAAYAVSGASPHGAAGQCTPKPDPPILALRVVFIAAGFFPFFFPLLALQERLWGFCRLCSIDRLRRRPSAILPSSGVGLLGVGMILEFVGGWIFVRAPHACEKGEASWRS